MKTYNTALICSVSHLSTAVAYELAKLNIELVEAADALSRIAQPDYEPLTAQALGLVEHATRTKIPQPQFRGYMSNRRRYKYPRPWKQES
jgi:hypothetical protein